MVKVKGCSLRALTSCFLIKDGVLVGLSSWAELGETWIFSKIGKPGSPWNFFLITRHSVSTKKSFLLRTKAF